VVAPTAATVDPSKPATAIQITLHNRSRLTAQFNLAAPVQDLYTYVASATPGAEFDLVTTYPRATLSDKAVTLEEAKLQNAAVQQVLK